ncbi:MAG: Gfo/Idh/MocA family oxidoreductase, partial [Planctomycetota bacterium]|nr:Gfo/Idh/MocA family oxidoreductase [Planctomycetota bacterium]
MQNHTEHRHDAPTQTGAMPRREFLKTAAVAGAGLVILPSGVVSGAGAPSNTLNIAMIGAAGRARAHFGSASKENIAALCDVDAKHLQGAAKKYPKAKTYVDWRKCLDQKDLDAVICCTTDHTHAFVSSWALNRDLHLYCEKPMGITVNEVRLLREKYLAKKDKLATQQGTQRHQQPNFNRVRELVIDGAIGELKAAWAWGNRKLGRPGYLPGKGSPPKTLDYDLWLGPAPYHPYNPGYFHGCLGWNMYRDFGTGQVGDMGSHTMDLVWNAIDAGLPTTAEASGDKFNPDIVPVRMTATWDIPANDWRPGIKVTWCMGGDMPKSPKGYVDLNKIGHGAMFKGDKGFVVCDFGSRFLMPWGSDADLSYYNKRPKDKMLPDLGHFQQDWIDACKGDLKTACDFKYSGDMM